MAEIEGKSILILGYGREGQSVHKYLLKHYPDRVIGIADLNEVKDCFDSKAKIHSGANYLSAISEYDVIVRSPGITLLTPEIQAARSSGKEVTSATNIFLSECQGTIVGITGTKGKSTTSTLIFAILSKHYPDVKLVGNIGQPSLDYLEGANEETIFVLELSSYQLSDVQSSPNISVLLNIVPEHLDYHGGFAGYVAAKENILKYQTKQDIIVGNPNHETVGQAIHKSVAQKIYFSPEKNFDYDYTAYIEDGYIISQLQNGSKEKVISVEEIPLIGFGNLENTLAATTVGIILNVPTALIAEAIKEFKPLRHRLEFVGEYRGIRFYDDSIATIPEAAINAIAALGDDVETLILGGHDRGLDFSELGTYIISKPIKTLILFPDTGTRIWSAVCQAEPEEKKRPQKYDVTSMEEAVKIVYSNTSPGKVCLLSPASPRTRWLFHSFDERGDTFKKYAIELGKSLEV
ncbi:UDP-N-acetylmuramoyl-L-alanine--D-glutamate ligase [Oscillatoria salina]|uniref:UDP-N-acetylmuramoyl-L-alanine--D-glutamate ligase n=1 Tax=Oscillatoria salina TaxID=331517 RepID=UPI001CC97256|nr:UDP-N-acetylmuramoyl-L-alanine--D-glutamate ligase [Oscillatoria salina]MBZ8181751.1 UDP-N-acetylmuramoyl-L-alanine--D-glutamate ligase [Oscillatoria salina IIICB1]